MTFFQGSFFLLALYSSLAPLLKIIWEEDMAQKHFFSYPGHIPHRCRVLAGMLGGHDMGTGWALAYSPSLRGL